MKLHFIFISLAVIAVVSCAKTEIKDTSVKSTNTIVATIQPFVAEDGTKADISLTGNFSWSAGDELSVWPLSVDPGQTPAQIKFSINDSSTGSSSATFTGTGWGLITTGDYSYYSYYPYNEEDNPQSVHISFPSHYVQKYTLDLSTKPYTKIIDNSHLGKSVYMYAPSITPDDPTEAAFNYYQLGTLAHFEFTWPTVPVSIYGSYYVTIKADAPVFVTEAYYDASATSSMTPPELTSVTQTDVITFSVNGGGSVSFGSGTKVDLYAIMCPADLDGITLTLKTYDYYGDSYSATKCCESDQHSGEMKKYTFGTLTKDVAATPSKVGVDLGTGILWATTNLGAQNPEDLGRKYAWGEKIERTGGLFNETNAPFGPQTTSAPLYGYSKYHVTTESGGDGLSQLELADDIANIKWGDGWRMPTNKEITDLTNKCDFELTYLNGIPGYKVFNKTDHTKMIFLPFSRCSYAFSNGIDGGDYWSSNLVNASLAYYMIMNKTQTPHWWMSLRRDFGAFVRPVKDKSVE